MELADLRKEIDTLDWQISKLLVQRFTITAEIGKVKEKLCIPVTDTNRENDVLEKIISEHKNTQSVSSLANIFKCIINESKNHQRGQQ